MWTHLRSLKTIIIQLARERLVFGLIKENSQDEAEASITDSTVSPEQFGEIMAMMVTNNISTTMAKNLLNVLYTTEVGRNPTQVAKDRGWELIKDQNKLRAICRRVIAECPSETLTKYYKSERNRTKIFKFLTGKAMAESRRAS